MIPKFDEKQVVPNYSAFGYTDYSIYEIKSYYSFEKVTENLDDNGYSNWTSTGAC